LTENIYISFIEDTERGSEVVKHVIKERRPNINRDS